MLSLGKYDEAQKIYAFIITENPNYVIANTNLGFLYMQQGNNTMAYDFLSKAGALDPDNEQVLINLAVYYHAQLQNDRARRCLEHLLKKHPANERAKAMLADLQQNP
jgi:tetratricopeptide (TPR) repeat protein